MDFDKHEIWAIAGLGIVGVFFFLKAAREETKIPQVTESLWDTPAYHLPNIRTGYVKHYPINHDFWWCEAQNDDVSRTGLSRWGRDYS